MKDIRYVSVNTILSKLRRDYNMDDDVHETDVIEWIGEALQAINAVTQYENAIAFIEVQNYTCCVPNGLQMIQQLARNNCWTSPEDKFCPLNVIESITEEETPSISPIAIDCNGSPLEDYELAYYRPYFDLQAEAPFVFSNTSFFKQCFTPIVPSSHSFFNVNPSNVPHTDKLYDSCEDEYQFIAKGTALRFSFESGAIAMSYIRTYVDDDGYPMIPDNFAYLEAVTKYILFKLMGQRFYRNEQGSDSRYSKAEQDWHWYCKQARNSLLMPKGEDDHQMLLQQRLHMLPKINRYYGFFGKMNKMEGKKFNDADGRNHNYFRGYNLITN